MIRPFSGLGTQLLAVVRKVAVDVALQPDVHVGTGQHLDGDGLSDQLGILDDTVAQGEALTAGHQRAQVAGLARLDLPRQMCLERLVDQGVPVDQAKLIQPGEFALAKLGRALPCLAHRSLVHLDDLGVEVDVEIEGGLPEGRQPAGQDAGEQDRHQHQTGDDGGQAHEPEATLAGMAGVQRALDGIEALTASGIGNVEIGSGHGASLILLTVFAHHHQGDHIESQGDDEQR